MSLLSKNNEFLKMCQKLVNNKLFARLHHDFYSRHRGISNIDDVLTRFGLLTKPLATVRFNREFSFDVKEARKAKLKQWFYFVNIHFETLRWFTLCAISIVFQENTKTTLFYKRLLGDFSFVIGGIPAFIYLTGALFSTICCYYSIIFFLAEHFNEAEKYLCWLDPILALKNEIPLEQVRMSTKAKNHIVAIWKYTFPIRICVQELFGVTLGLFFFLIMRNGYNLSNPFESAIVLFYTLQNVITCHYFSNAAIIMTIYLVMISESFRLRFKKIGENVNKISRCHDRSKPRLLAKCLGDFDLACRTLHKYNVVMKVLVFMFYGFSADYICLPLYHIFHVDAVWLLQFALVIVCCLSVPITLTNVFLFGALSSEVILAIYIYYIN